MSALLRVQGVATANGSTQAIGDAGLGDVIRRHLHLHLVTHDKTDEALPHLARNVGENLVTTGQLNAELGAGKHRGDRTIDFDRLLLPVRPELACSGAIPVSTSSTAATTSSKSLAHAIERPGTIARARRLILKPPRHSTSKTHECQPGSFRQAELPSRFCG